MADEEEKLEWNIETAATADQRQFQAAHESVDHSIRAATANPSDAASPGDEAPSSAGGGTGRGNSRNGRGGGGGGRHAREAMSVPVASLGNNTQQQQQQPSKAHQISNQLLDGARRVTTQERQRDRVYKKELLRQEKGNADVDYSSWESGNAPDAMSLRSARAMTTMVRDLYSSVAAMRREMRQRSVDALTNGSSLSEEAGRAVQGAMGDIYGLSTDMVRALEDGLRSVMPLFASSMRNTEGLTTLVQIREHIGSEAARDVNAAAPTSAAILQARKRQQQQRPAAVDTVPVPPPIARSGGAQAMMIPQPPSSTTNKSNSIRVSRLDHHPIYDREAESSDHTSKSASHQVAPMTAAASSARGLTSSPPAIAALASKCNSDPRSTILTTLKQVEAEIQERGEIWPPDQRRHQAHSTLHQRVHPNIAESCKRVEKHKQHLLAKHNVSSIVPPLLNKLVLASLPQSARGGGPGTPSASSHGVHSARTTTTTVSEMRKIHREQMKMKQKLTDASAVAAPGETDIGAASAPTSARMASPILAAQAAAGDQMVRYGTTADGFASRIMCLREPKLGVWRQLSVTEKQHIVAFEQRENRYHHAHGITNMKLAGLRAKKRRSEKTGIELSPADIASFAEAIERKRLLEETRHADVRQCAVMLRAWMNAPVPDKFSDHPTPPKQF